ncbi:hypothetical protein MNV49_007558 [Pseudohyphozyma bogoriensis]|nr:hypothetical protein MNV49_007558 [Pseudohyphozyma bogoriensis]
MATHDDDDVPPPYISGSTGSQHGSARLEKYSNAFGSILESSGDDIVLHVYKDKMGPFKWDDIVLGADKETPEYYLKFPAKLLGKWDMKLHRGTREGPVIFTITKGMGLRSNMTLTGASGFKTDLKKTRWWAWAHDFKTVTGSTYKWKSQGATSTDWHLFNSSKSDEVVAEWRKTNWAKKKGGVLTIKGKYFREKDLILATALAMAGASTFPHFTGGVGALTSA